MAKQDLAKLVEALAAEVVMADPEDLQSVKRVIELLKKIDTEVKDDLARVFKPAVAKSVDLAEEMIIMEPAAAAESMKAISQAVKAFQAGLTEGPQAVAPLLPPQMSGAKEPTGAEKLQSAIVDDKILSDFLSSQATSLQELEEQILASEKEQFSGKSSSELKRRLHTLKGEAGMLGLNDIQQVCHETESYLENGPADNKTDNLLLVKDWLAQSFTFLSGEGQSAAPMGDILNILRGSGSAAAETKAAPLEKAGEAPEAEAAPAPVEEPAQPAGRMLNIPSGDESLVVDFIQEANSHLDNADVQLLTLESNPEEKESLNSVFRSFHTIKGVAGFLDLIEIKELAHVSEDLLDRARKGNILLTGTVMDAVFESVDTLRSLVRDVEGALSTGDPLQSNPSLATLIETLRDILAGRQTLPAAGRQIKAEPNKRLGEILIDSGVVQADTLNRVLAERDGKTPLGEVLVKKVGVPAMEVAHALRAQNEARKTGDPQQAAVQVKETVKIDTERLDKLLDAIGELVIAESMVTQNQELLQDASPEVARNMNHLSKITRVVQELGMTMRMVPIRPTFQKMARLVRDLAKKSGKEVEFVTVGEETELDRSVVERIGDPLIHIIRNSVDHGLEDNAEDRRKRGKPDVGHVELRAFHRGGSIYIEVQDDGKGLDREAIIAKAVERGVIPEGADMPERDVFNLIFMPGFSTAKKVTDVSGRGVGMDVVKKNIEALRGSVELSSEQGCGTTVSMRLPLTLAIIDGLIIIVGGERYIVPTLSVVESLRPRPEDIHTVSGRGELLNLRGELIPLFRVGRLFNIEAAIEDPTQALSMIVEDQGRRVALVVDSLIGQQQVVIKNLGHALGRVKGISGGAVMSDGTVGLILDVSEVMRIAMTSQEKSLQVVGV
ncbi:chemotaxis protein CheA [bacterium]|nr:chemotaxis protein CheA [bacterium]